MCRDRSEHWKKHWAKHNKDGHCCKHRGGGKFLGVFLGALIVFGLWNMLVPRLFGGPPITYFQALGLLILSRVLFGGGMGRGWRGKAHVRWRKKMKEKMKDMSPEQRKEFKEKLMGWDVNVIEVEEEEEDEDDNGEDTDGKKA